MTLDQLGDQVSGRMLVEIGAEIGDPNALMRPALAGPERGGQGADFVGDERAGALQVQVRLVTEPDEREWIDDRLALGDQRFKPRQQLRGTRPVADRQRRLGEAAVRIRMIRAQRDCLLVARNCISVPLERIERISPAELRFGMIGPPALGLVEVLQRLTELAERRQRAAAVVESIGIVRPQLERALIALNRLVIVFEPLQRVATVVERLDVGRGAREHLLEALKRLLLALEPLPGVATVVEGIDRGRLDRQGLVEALERLLVAAQRVEDQSLVREGTVRARAQLERGLEELERLRVAALLIADDTEHVAGIEVPWLCPQNLRIECLGLRELPLPMAGDRAIEQLAQRMRCLPRSRHGDLIAPDCAASHARGCRSASTAKACGASPRCQISHIVE